jgi:hypothetical protein
LIARTCRAALGNKRKDHCHPRTFGGALKTDCGKGAEWLLAQGAASKVAAINQALIVAAG